MASIRSFATLDQLRSRRGLGVSDTSDNQTLIQKLRTASAEIEQVCAREFIPTREIRLFDWQGAKEIRFRGFDALVIYSVTDGMGVAANLSAINWLGSGNNTYGPWYGGDVDIAQGSFLTYRTTKTRAIQVDALWGYHDEYSTAWRDSTDTLSAAITTTTATTLTVNNAAGADAWGLTPRFSVGNLIQVDTEWMWIVGISTNTLTVVRGAQGTTAATHLISAPISVYVPPADITDICLRWASWLFTQDSTSYGKTIVGPFGMTVPAGAPPDLVDALSNYRKMRVG